MKFLNPCGAYKAYSSSKSILLFYLFEKILDKYLKGKSLSTYGSPSNSILLPSTVTSPSSTQENFGNLLFIKI